MINVCSQFKIVIIFISALLLTSCGGGTASTGGTPAASTATGIFRDSNTAGLSYVSGAQTGVTDANGQFTYEVGGMVTFSVGGVTLGTTLGKTIITPVDLVAGGSSSSVEVQNITRFLLMLDEDGNSANGINISAAAQTASANWVQVNFLTADLPSELTSIISDAATADNGNHTLPNTTSAQTHLEETILCTYAGAYRGTYTGNDNGTFGLLVDANNGNVSGLAYSTDSQEDIILSGTDSVSFDQNAAFVSGNTSTGTSFSGRFTSTNALTGTWENSPESGGFSGSRIGGSNNARYRYTGSYSGGDSGLFSFDIDALNNVSGLGYSIAGDELLNISGTLSGSALTITSVNGTSISGSLNTTTGSLSGTWSDSTEGTSGTFTGSGCELNAPPSTSPANSQSIDGFAVASPISGGNVKLYELKEIGVLGTDVLATATTGTDGSFQLDMTGLSGNYLVEISGGTYIDEASGTSTTNSVIRSVIFDWESGKGPFTISVTPLTELGIQIAASLRPEDIEAAFKNAAIFAGGLDIANTRPQALTGSATATRDELEYGAALAALSQLSMDQSYGSVDNTLTVLLNDFSDGRLDGAGAIFITAFETFLESTQNQSAFNTTLSSIPGVVQASIQNVQPIDNLSVVDCNRTSCSQPSVQGLTVRAEVAKPFPALCDTTVSGSCSAGDYLNCYGNTCLTYTDKPATGQWYSSVCNWFWGFDVIGPANVCAEGRGLSSAHELGLNACTSPSSTARGNGSCPRDGRITLVAPSDTNLKGALFVHDGTRLITIGGANAHHPFKDRKMVSDFSNYIEADCTQVGADGGCYQILDVFMDPGWKDVGSHTWSMLTTYGFEWDVAINVPDGAHMICNIMNGECAEKINTGAEGEVKVTLSWQTANSDMDVHLFDPCGNEIYYGGRTQVCNTLTGELDVDDLGFGPLIENIAYANGAPAGDYRVEVDNFSGTGTVNYSLKIIFGASVEIHQGSLNSADNNDTYNFTLVK